MTLINIAVPDRTITNIADDIREKIAQVVSLANIRLHEIRNLVRTHTRAAIADELGSDAAYLLVVYTKLKEAIEVAKHITVEDLP